MTFPFHVIIKPLTNTNPSFTQPTSQFQFQFQFQFLPSFSNQSISSPNSNPTSQHNQSIQMDLWTRARTFAEEAAKRSQEFTIEAAKKSQELTIEATKRSQELTSTIRFSDIVSETAKRSRELAVGASTQIKAEALKRADQIKSLSLIDPSSVSPSSSESDNKELVAPEELLRFGVTDELREFVKEIKLTTFQDFPLPDDDAVSDVPTVSNVRQDLTEWQATHATLVLSTVKEISKLRYELCPRFMKERKFWRIYFLLVHSHVSPYEKKYMEEAKVKAAEVEKDAKAQDPTNGDSVAKPVVTEASKPLKKATSSSDQDLDVFLLGDLGDSDDGADVGDDGFDDDFDKIDDSLDDEGDSLEKVNTNLLG